MPDFKTKMHQIQFRLGRRPSPTLGSLQRSPGLAGFKGPTSKGKEWKGWAMGCEKGSEGEGRRGEWKEGGEGRGEKGRGAYRDEGFSLTKILNTPLVNTRIYHRHQILSYCLSTSL